MIKDEIHYQENYQVKDEENIEYENGFLDSMRYIELKSESIIDNLIMKTLKEHDKDKGINDFIVKLRKNFIDK